MIIDSHCHLDNEKLQPSIQEIIKNAEKSNVKFMLTICTNNESFKKIIDILETYQNILAHTAYTHMKQTITRIFQLILSPNNF